MSTQANIGGIFCPPWPKNTWDVLSMGCFVLYSPWQLPRSATEFKINFLFVRFFKLMLNIQVNSYDHAGMLSS